MIKPSIAAFLLAAALPCAAAEAPGASPASSLAAPVIEVSDQALAKATLLFVDLNQRIGAITGESSAPSPCHAGFTMDSLMRKIAAKEISETLLAELLASNVMDILRYYDYRAFALKDFSVCDTLRVLPASFNRNVTSLNVSADWVCRNELHCNQYGYNIVTSGADFLKVCERWIEYRTPEFKKDAAAICKIMAADKKDPDKLCSKMARYPRIWPDDWTDPNGVVIKEDDCLAINKAYNGDESLCHPEDGDECRDYARFARAYKAQDPKLCEQSNFCRLLMGAPADIADSFADRVRNRYCELAEPGLKPALDPAQKKTVEAAAQKLFLEGGKPILALLGGAERLLGDAEMIAAKDPGVLLAVADRSQRIARLKEQYQGLKPGATKPTPTRAP